MAPHARLVKTVAAGCDPAVARVDLWVSQIRPADEESVRACRNFAPFCRKNALALK